MPPSVRVLEHPLDPGVIDLPGQEDPVMGDLSAGEKRTPGITLRSLRHYVPGGHHAIVNHLGEPHVPEIKQNQNQDQKLFYVSMVRMVENVKHLEICLICYKTF